MAARKKCIPIPPLTLWGGIAAYTLVATAAGTKGIDRVEHVPIEGGGYACVYPNLALNEAVQAIVDAVLSDPGMYAVKQDAAKRLAALRDKLGDLAAKLGVSEQLLLSLLDKRTIPVDIALELERAGVRGLVSPLPVTRAVAIGLTRHDTKKDGYLSQIASKLCISKSANNITVEDLVEAVARALRGECETAWEPTTSLTLFRAEYYKYKRLYSPRPLQSLEARWHVKIPAVAQALGLLGHAYTSIYASRRDNMARHLAAPLPPGITPSSIESASKVYVAVKALLRRAWRDWSQKLGGLPWATVSLIVGSLLWESGFNRDYLEEVVVSGGNTVSVNEIIQIPGQPVARLLEAVGRVDECGRLAPSWYKPVLVEGFDKGFPKAVAAGVLVDRIPQKVGDRDLDQEARRAMVEFSSLFVQYAFTFVEGRPQPELAYAAARTAEMYYDSISLALARVNRRERPWWLRVLACAASRAVEARPGIIA